MTERLRERRPKAPDVGKLLVCAKQCGRCLFGADPHLPWNGPGGGDEKVRKIIATRASHFTCHEWSNVMCRGFYNAHGRKIWYVQIANRLKAIKFVDKQPKEAQQ